MHQNIALIEKNYDNAAMNALVSLIRLSDPLVYPDPVLFGTHMRTAILVT